MDRAESQAIPGQAAFSEALGVALARNINNDGHVLGREDSNLQSPDPESGAQVSGGLSTGIGAAGLSSPKSQATRARRVMREAGL